MSDTTKVKSSRLKFKGEKHAKRKREHTDDQRPRKQRKEDDRADEDWVQPENPSELRGPTFIYHPSDPLPCTITYNSTTAKLVISNLDASDEPILTRTPTDVSQVWVLTRVAGSPTINIRTGTGEGKFLSSDAHGLISADRDARGPQEEWTPVVLPDGMVAFMNVYEKYLSVDEVAGGAVVLRADSEEVGFRERFWVKIQYKYKKEAHEEEKQKTLKDAVDPVSIDEVASNKTFQAWGAGRSVVSEADKKELKRAKKEGRLAEAMLDRRAKLKSDRFC
ncbi:hypothetical protein MIND_01020400 [Mycena indigotica]|uniref:Actin-bundling protein n=1 Tax=Mycena indigotica TaxID=2126181 RepID=A0A8H6S9U2_9AGAR|nr:uncharacterized protein MIND_01020400 [Mycena indigotica]KAF7294825.1 hypothetical protein MIND_01020400 [Mycena indigotica]